MAAAAWLTRYYNERHLAELSPEVVYEGNAFALVRLSRVGQVGYVMVDKRGAHPLTSPESLHVGMASASDMEKMKRIVDGAEKRAQGRTHLG
jgi:hypothetical protein